MDIAAISSLLERKKELLHRFEAATREMLACGRDQLAGLVQERERLIQEAGRLDAEMEGCCQQPEEQALLRGLLRGEDGPQSPALEPVRQGARDVRAILSRLREDDLQASLRLRVEQERILEQIKAANQGGAAKAARFYSLSRAKSSGRQPLGTA